LKARVSRTLRPLSKSVLPAILLSCAGTVLAQTSPESLTVISSRGRETLPVFRLANVPMLRLDDLAPLVGASLRAEQGSATATFSIGSRSATVSSGRSLVPVADRLILLPAPATLQAGSFWVPLEFLNKVLPEISNQKILYRPDARLLILGEGYPRLGVRTFPYPGYTRVVLEPSTTMPYQVSQEEGQVRVLLQAPFIETEFEREELRDGVVEQLALTRQKEGYLLEIRLGERFASLKAFELESPHRLVLDLLRSRAELAAPVVIPTDPARAKPFPAPDLPPPPSSVRPTLRTITLDPGHGGAELGARGPAGLQEKDVTLALARRLRQVLESQLGLHVVLTRDGDQNLGLDERTAVANNNKSDVFLSIHANASPRTAARGSETYFLSYEPGDEDARRVALAENAAGGRSGLPGGNRELDFILWDMAQAAHLNESAALAEILQEELNGPSEEKNRGIKQAPFRVLMGATMPAVLVEIGFITNPEEEHLLGNSAHQNKLAQDIYRGILRFKERYERRYGASEPDRLESKRP
jgi:N-acetylmuramoyl-L-alanine amidase